MTISQINEKQPHILVETDDKINVVPVSLLREIANGTKKPDNDLSMIIAKALVDLIQD